MENKQKIFFEIKVKWLTALFFFYFLFECHSKMQTNKQIFASNPSYIINKLQLFVSTVMKATPYLEEVFHLIINLLKDQGHEQIAEQLEEHYELPEWIRVNNPLLKKGLTKIIKDYVKNNEKMLKYFQNRVQNQQTEEVAKRTRKQSADSRGKSSSPKVQISIHTSKKVLGSKVASPKNVTSPKHAASPKNAASKQSSWMSKFQKPKTLEEINQVIEPAEKQVAEEVVVKHSKNKKHKKAQVQSSDYESQEDSFELEPKKKLKKQAKEEKKKQKKAKKVAKEQKSEEQIQEEQEVPKKQEKKATIKNHVEYKPKYPSEQASINDGYPKQFFSRINPDEVGPIREELRDNSFQAKAKFGQEADHWGQFGYEKLKDTRGDSFKKTKGKLKNRAFQGALMDINKINSIPIA